MAKTKKFLKKTSAKKASKKKKNSVRKINSGDWPYQKKILFRPDRSPYIRRQNRPVTGCVFCKAADDKESFETLCVYKNDHSMVVLNKYPYNSGHLLILPRRHGGDILSLTQKEYQDLHETLKLSLQAQNEIYQPAASNVGMNHGAAAGAGLPDHLHYHLIPRWAGDLNFFPLIAETKVVIESLEQTYQRYFEYFKSLKG
ncbi:MAG: HIT domain-containing protein [Bdellovibrionota bacterium]